MGRRISVAIGIIQSSNVKKSLKKRPLKNAEKFLWKRNIVSTVQKWSTLEEFTEDPYVEGVWLNNFLLYDDILFEDKKINRREKEDCIDGVLNHRIRA